jgi:hypothetical protein
MLLRGHIDESVAFRCSYLIKVLLISKSIPTNSTLFMSIGRIIPHAHIQGGWGIDGCRARWIPINGNRSFCKPCRTLGFAGFFFVVAQYWDKVPKWNKWMLLQCFHSPFKRIFLQIQITRKSENGLGFSSCRAILNCRGGDLLKCNMYLLSNLPDSLQWQSATALRQHITCRVIYLPQNQVVRHCNTYRSTNPLSCTYTSFQDNIVLTGESA